MNQDDLKLQEAIREIEEIEDELNNREIDDLRERLTDARADIVEVLLDESMNR